VLPDSESIRIEEIKPEKEEADIVYNGHEVRQVEIFTNDNSRIFIGTAVSSGFPSELRYVEGMTNSANDKELIPPLEFVQTKG
jgi:hypothetical protein